MLIGIAFYCVTAQLMAIEFQKVEEIAGGGNQVGHRKIQQIQP